MININNDTKRVDYVADIESQGMINKRDTERFLNVSPKNYIKLMSDISSKKSIIPMVLIEIMDKNNIINHTLDELSDIIEYPKTGLSTVFREYKNKDFIKRIRNGVYMINPMIAHKGSKYERDKLMEKYSSIK